MFVDYNLTGNNNKEFGCRVSRQIGNLVWKLMLEVNANPNLLFESSTTPNLT